ncbi:MAG TPA: glucose/sorbosone family PQQ-dependent dehydrogenase [Polyangiaceae bacterium]|nr:glucose/sorbosone family PQQ-dependent dehydrogenase [Polyangiaceae bacterium]
MLLGVAGVASHVHAEDGGPAHRPSLPGADAFRSRVVSSGLEYPYEVTWGPDGYLWVTERTGKRVTRIHPVDGSKRTALELPEVHQSAGQDGLLGMALHPELLHGAGKDYVYLAFTYDAAARAAGAEAEPTPFTLARRVELRRYTYDAATQTLGDPHTLIDGLPASNDHNSGRLKIGPDQKLYYTLGDQGNNQFDNKCRPIRAQELPTEEMIAKADWSLYVGKILRLELDGRIPFDNPRLAGVRSHVFSYGHRNAQGIVFGPTGILYAAEHGPKSDDEINVIEAGHNYGWPQVAGFQDDQAYEYANWSASPECTTLPFDDYVVPPSVPIELESAWPGSFEPPIQTFYTVPVDYEFVDPACRGNDYICWPTIAPASLDLYGRHPHGIPGWANSLLTVSLKRGAVLRSALSRNGRAVVGETEELFRTINRYRDLAQAPDGRAFYVVTDTGGQTSGPTEGFTGQLDNPGALLEFAYAPLESTPPPTSDACEPEGCEAPSISEANGRYRFEFGASSAEVDSEHGGRITTFAWRGTNILTGPDVVSAGDAATQNNFGSTFWTSPQSVWSWPPEARIDSDPYAASLADGELTLESQPGPITGFAVEKTFAASERLSIAYTLRNTSAEARAAAPWEISRVPKAGLILFPARFVPLPQSTLSSELRDGIAWIDLSAPPATDAKLFQDGDDGWLAYILGDLAFIKVFDDVPPEAQAPGEAEIEVYVSGSFDYIELEQQGPYTEIPSGARGEPWRVDWLVRPLPAHVRAHVGNAGLVRWVRENVTH